MRSFCEGMRCRGLQRRRTADLPRVLDEAFFIDGPVVIDAIVDPYEPPMPPKVTREQAAHFARPCSGASRTA